MCHNIFKNLDHTSCNRRDAAKNIHLGALHSLLILKRHILVENLDGNREEVDDAEFNTREARDETEPARVKERGDGGEQEKLISAIDNCKLRSPF